MQHRGSLRSIALVCSLAACGGGAQADLGFDARVANPTFIGRHPVVMIDEAHHNIHTRGGRYAPFARLLTSDGYAAVSNRESFTSRTLARAQILVIANPTGRPNKASPAFTEAECDAVKAWVAAGGALLLVTDHAPIGSAAEGLARRFDVDFGKGEVRDPKHAAPGARDPAQLVFTRADATLGKHPILEGRGAAERIERVMTFTGQSLRGPAGSAPLLVLSDSAVDLPLLAVVFEPGWLGDSLRMTLGDPVPATGRSQALAMTYGRGRIVVTGEAAMLTAQVQGGEKFGMNVPGTDNRQLVLNIVHWLSGSPAVTLAVEADVPQGGTEYVLVIGLLTLVAFAVIAVFSWLEQRREREYLVTIRAYLEHGQAPPPELVRGPTQSRAMRIRRGLVVVAVGGALIVIFAVNPGVSGSWALGLLPIAVGVARIVGALIDDK